METEDVPNQSKDLFVSIRHPFALDSEVFSHFINV